MDNNSIINKINAILEENQNNFCDLLIALKDFNKEYKQTDFYKKVRLPLFDFVKMYKSYSLLNMELIFNEIQTRIKNLDLSNLMPIVEELGLVIQSDTLDLKDELESSTAQITDIFNIKD